MALHRIPRRVELARGGDGHHAVATLAHESAAPERVSCPGAHIIVAQRSDLMVDAQEWDWEARGEEAQS